MNALVNRILCLLNMTKLMPCRSQRLYIFPLPIAVFMSALFTACIAGSPSKLLILPMTNSETAVEYIEHQTGIEPIASVIWLHGLGADAHDFVPVVPQLGLPEDLPVRFIFPSAPIRPITVNGGMTMRGWYDIKSMSFEDRADRAGLDESAGIVQGLIQQENARGVPTNRIVLMGFSQGGAVSLYAGLRMTESLAGIGALSTYLPFPQELPEMRALENSDTPVLMVHGTHDPVIPMQLARQSFETLRQIGQPVVWLDYEMEHSVNSEEIREIGLFLTEVLSSEGS